MIPSVSQNVSHHNALVKYKLNGGWHRKRRCETLDLKLIINPFTSSFTKILQITNYLNSKNHCIIIESNVLH